MLIRLILLSVWLQFQVTIVSSLSRDEISKPGYRVFERHRAPKSLIRTEIPTDHQNEMTLRIGLRQPQIQRVHQKLYDVSDPKSSFYGKHMTLDEVVKLTSPSETAVSSVLRWLISLGFKEGQIRWSKSRDWVTVEDIPLAQVENMLDTKYFYFQDAEGNNLLRTEQYGLPHYLHEHVDLVQPTTLFGRLRQERSNIAVIEPMPIPYTFSYDTSTKDSKCHSPFAVSNQCLRELYHASDYIISPNSKSKIGITGFLGELAGYEDLKQFMTRERPDVKHFNYSVEALNGGAAGQTISEDNILRREGIEANLDLQTTMGFTSPGIENVFYSVGGSPPFKPTPSSRTNTNEPYLEWVEYISNQDDERIPKVISTSYGDVEETVPESYARRVCDHFASLGARGISLIFSSGDDGVGHGNCSSGGKKNSTRFQANFPASCPFVTAVGATEGFSPEVAASLTGAAGYPSGGGFSEYFHRPDYQSKDVTKYIEKLNGTFEGYFSPNGRAYPDVSAQGAKYIVAYQKNFLLVGGTSASAPTFAAIIALLNDYNHSQGKGPMGFLNPWLYSVGRNGFTDVVEGSAAGCNTSGFPALEGWDPVTGLGTPHFKNLAKYSSKINKIARKYNGNGSVNGGDDVKGNGDGDDGDKDNDDDDDDSDDDDDDDDDDDSDDDDDDDSDDSDDDDDDGDKGDGDDNNEGVDNDGNKNVMNNIASEKKYKQNKIKFNKTT
ncbi:peptidase S8/S53 domain-containing protein [Phakopsora pachyrhizi]|uniref:tripeptidyl-peptidase II n=1 Tax=Phakopsora pachyrhizi TaxID=170000 RepID=A0AAV0AT07_PHAPC|nr:peptidase S8/S53 domain-containing protein [Phakopsora pachyrhizi]CAH7671953.1 peptidase S8/S53 domain-containing protein [Phakopsora pachyrhizi]CAH7675056.1 peptidase S8/S53 domain-containing protein [Phakopsora pachyrhizi]